MRHILLLLQNINVYVMFIHFILLYFLQNFVHNHIIKQVHTFIPIHIQIPESNNTHSNIKRVSNDFLLWLKYAFIWYAFVHKEGTLSFNSTYLCHTFAFKIYVLSVSGDKHTVVSKPHFCIGNVCNFPIRIRDKTVGYHKSIPRNSYVFLFF